MTIACTSINNEPLSTSLLGKKEEINVLNSVFDKTDGTSLDQIADQTHTVAPAVLENWINSTDGRPQTGFNVTNLRNRNEAYAGYTHPSKKTS